MGEPTEPQARCPSCGAAVYAGADWCNLCFTPIRRGTEAEAAAREAGPAPTAAGPSAAAPPIGSAAVSAGAEAGGAFWPCPVCEERNPIALDVCAVCGTPFATVLRQERERPQVDPSVAFGRSLLFPGLGHAKLGLGAEGFARGALFVILLLVTLLIGFAGASSALLRILLLTFASGTIGVYLLTAVEARRIAEGGSPMVSTRLLLWVTVGVLMAAMGLIVVVIGTTPTR
jgi:hypothetical protein